MIKVEAINNESMWVDERRVIMVGPLMDRGIRQLGCAVLYFEGLPPLPCKETVDDLSQRVIKGVQYGYPVEDSGSPIRVDGPADGGQEARLVV